MIEKNHTRFLNLDCFELFKPESWDACAVNQDSAGRFVDCTPNDASATCGNTTSCGCA